MGIYADTLASAKTFTPTSRLARYLEERIALADPAAPSLIAAVDTEQILIEDSVAHTGGDFTLTVKLRGVPPFTTAAIAFNATEGTIEGAIDTAATAASVPGWTNGDISVTADATDLQDGDVILAFNGTSVNENDQPLVVFTDSMTGGTSPATRETLDVQGQSTRNAVGVLIALGVIDSSAALPTQRQSPADPSLVTLGSNLNKTPTDVVLSLCQEAAADDDNNNSYFTLVNKLYGEADRAPLTEAIGTSSA